MYNTTWLPAAPPTRGLHSTDGRKPRGRTLDLPKTPHSTLPRASRVSARTTRIHRRPPASTPAVDRAASTPWPRTRGSRRPRRPRPHASAVSKTRFSGVSRPGLRPPIRVLLAMGPTSYSPPPAARARRRSFASSTRRPPRRRAPARGSRARAKSPKSCAKTSAASDSRRRTARLGAPSVSPAPGVWDRPPSAITSRPVRPRATPAPLGPGPRSRPRQPSAARRARERPRPDPSIATRGSASSAGTRLSGSSALHNHRQMRQTFFFSVCSGCVVVVEPVEHADARATVGGGLGARCPDRGAGHPRRPRRRSRRTRRFRRSDAPSWWRRRRARRRRPRVFIAAAAALVRTPSIRRSDANAHTMSSSAHAAARRRRRDAVLLFRPPARRRGVALRPVA